MGSAITDKKGENAALSVFISGDFAPCMIPRESALKENAAETLLGLLCNVIREADLSITNLESPLTFSKKAIKKIGPAMKAHPDWARFLKSAGFDVVALANNHIYDYGEEGFSDTLEALGRNGIQHVGAGKTLNDARETFYTEIRGIRLGIVNFAEVEYTCAERTQGGANPMDLIDNVHQIKEARKKADHVLVIVHGGHEFFHYPSPEVRKRYRFYAEAGAAAVIAHHTHCIGGYERFEGVPIFYSLGNFVFPTAKTMPSSWYEGYAVVLQINRTAVAFEILPYEQGKDRNFSLDLSRDKEIRLKIDAINRILNDDDALSNQWEHFVSDHAYYYLAGGSGLTRYPREILRRLRILALFNRTGRIDLIRHIIRCEAHKEAATAAMTGYLKKKRYL